MEGRMSLAFKMRGKSLGRKKESPQSFRAWKSCSITNTTRRTRRRILVSFSISSYSFFSLLDWFGCCSDLFSLASYPPWTHGYICGLYLSTLVYQFVHGLFMYVSLDDLYSLDFCTHSLALLYNDTFFNWPTKLIIQEFLEQCLEITIQNEKTTTDWWINVPAAIVSPPLRSKTLPISLLVENCSKGMPFSPAVFPALRRDISTSAEACFVRTLMRSFSKRINSEQANKIHRGFFFLTSPVVRSIKERSLLVVAGTSLDWLNNSTWT